MTEEKKVYSLKFTDGKLLIELDPNRDGQPVMKLEVDVMEIPDEVISAITSWRSKK